MSDFVDFIKENGQTIVGIILFVLLLLVIIGIKGIDLNVEKPKSKLVQEVTIEKFSPNLEDLEKACNQLTIV